MLQWTFAHNNQDKTRNEEIQRKIGASPEDKCVEGG